MRTWRKMSKRARWGLVVVYLLLCVGGGFAVGLFVLDETPAAARNTQATADAGSTAALAATAAGEITQRPATAAVPSTQLPTPTAPATTAAASGPTFFGDPPVTATRELDWPHVLPGTMRFVAEDSWPFRVISQPQQTEPFLVFRDGSRWLVIRNQVGDAQPIPASATRTQLSFAGAAGTLIKYRGDGFKLIAQRGNRTLQMSGIGLEDAEIMAVAESLQTLTSDELRDRLTQAAAQQRFHITTLWPNYLPAGLALVPSETTVNLVLPAAGPAADSYRVMFARADAQVTIGGGIEPPTLSGTVEQIQQGSLTGTLTAADKRFLLTIDAEADGGSGLHFPSVGDGSTLQLPLVQGSRIFVEAQNVEREQFDKIIANLVNLRAEEFEARARGINTSYLTYLWTSVLPNGYTLDRGTVRVGWDDFLLQGGRPFFEIQATNDGGGTVTIKGGREANGNAFNVPEGEGVLREAGQIHSRTASVAQAANRAVVFWKENESLYWLDSPSLAGDQLITLGEALQQIDMLEFFRRIE